MYHCTADLLFDWFGLVCFANKNKIVSCHTPDSKPVKQKVNGTVILPLWVFLDWIFKSPPLWPFSGLYYKRITIVIDAPSIISK